MDGYAPGEPSVELSIEESATVKSSLPSVVAHSDALESYSLFCTMYVPPDTDAVCSWHSDVVAAWAPGLAASASCTVRPPELAASARTQPTATSSAAAAASADLERVIGYLRAQRLGWPRLMPACDECVLCRKFGTIVASAAAVGQERNSYDPFAAVKDLRVHLKHHQRSGVAHDRWKTGGLGVERPADHLLRTNCSCAG